MLVWTPPRRLLSLESVEQCFFVCFSTKLPKISVFTYLCGYKGGFMPYWREIGKVQIIKGNALGTDFVENLLGICQLFATYLTIAYAILIRGVSN